MNQAIGQYCEGCGKPLAAQARFCGRCGRPVPPKVSASVQQQPQPSYAPTPPPQVVQQSPPPTAAPPAEIVVMALPVGAQRSGFLGMKADGFILVLTNARILFAKQTSELMKENARVAKETAKQSGKGFFGQWSATMGSAGSQRYLQMHPQQILNETAGNYFILNQQIRSVRLKESYDPDTVKSEVKLILESVNGKIELIYTQASKKELKQALQQTLGNLVR